MVQPSHAGCWTGLVRLWNPAISAVQVSVLVGLIYIALGALRLGFLTNFLSHSVISGFTTGAAVVIGVSQVRAVKQLLCIWRCLQLCLHAQSAELQLHPQ
jgi:hypothetical protein